MRRRRGGFVLPVKRIALLTSSSAAAHNLGAECKLRGANVEVEAYWRGCMVDGNHGHVDVRQVGAHVEITQPVESGGRVIKVVFDIAVEHETEVGA